ncbi:27090_t:CDS:2 [Dentiscutata erythropus]|uniref:27090_t:CDS:1 n=1 Tax=Dentiscutata erythropus TaxID=1348616 RepID=A0A9N8YW38_9GLOM|nr:27090_t:CDS:2 [Dentiscutata erythropus]
MLIVLTIILGEVEAMEEAWSYQPASPRGEGLHTQGHHQMETNRHGCCKQPVPCSQRRGITSQLLRMEKGYIHEGVTKETNRRGCCKQPTQRRGITNQLLQKEKSYIHESVTKETNHPSPRGEGLYTQGHHQMETNRHGCYKQLVPCSKEEMLLASFSKWRRATQRGRHQGNESSWVL